MERKKLHHKFQGCIKYEDKVYSTFEEFANFCQTYKYLKGGDLASILTKATVNESKNLLEVVKQQQSLFDQLF